MFGGGQKDAFFDMFDKAAQNAHEGAKALQDLLEHYDDVPNKVRRIKDLEHTGDELTHGVLDKLAKTFITPFDREDIQRVTTRLDDVIDQIDMAANRLMIYKVAKITPDGLDFGRVLVKATAVLLDAFTNLRHLKKAEAMKLSVVEIHTLENEGDRLLQHAIGALFEQEADAREIIKWKDIYQILEKATDRCEDVAEALQTIMMKHG